MAGAFILPSALLLLRRPHPEPPRRHPAQALGHVLQGEFDEDAPPILPQPLAQRGGRPAANGCQAVSMMRAFMAGHGWRGNGRPARVRGASAPATDTPAAFGFRRFERNAWDGGLFGFGPSGPIVSSETAKTEVVVAVVGVVVVAVRRPHVARVVVPGPAAQDTVRAGCSTAVPNGKIRGRTGRAQAGSAATVPVATWRRPRGR